MKYAVWITAIPIAVLSHYWPPLIIGWAIGVAAATITMWAIKKDL